MATATEDLTAMTPDQIDRAYKQARLEAARAALRLESELELAKKDWAPADVQQRIDEAREARNNTAEAVERVDREYAARPWTRYWWVPNGHVHAGNPVMNGQPDCSTCYPTTRYMLLDDQSGKTDIDLLILYGEKMCTICFPQAETDPRHQRPGLLDQQQIAQRQQAAAQRAADKEAKAIYAPDGSPLKVPQYGRIEKLETVKTKHAAKSLLSRRIGDWINITDGYGEANAEGNVDQARHYADNMLPAIEACVDTLIEALNHVDIDPYDIVDKGVAKVRKQWRTWNRQIIEAREDGVTWHTSLGDVTKRRIRDLDDMPQLPSRWTRWKT